MLQIQPSDVIITNIQNNARGELEFVMYIQVAGGAQVLPVEALESAVQVTVFYFNVLFYIFLKIIRCGTSRCKTFVRPAPILSFIPYMQSGINDYMAAGFGSVEFVRAVPTSTTSTSITGLPPGVIAAIAAGSVFGVVLVLILLLLCILLW